MANIAWRTTKSIPSCCYHDKRLSIRRDATIILWSFVCKTDFHIYLHLYQVGNKSVGGSGIVVSKIAEGGPAAMFGGLRVHDRIMKVGLLST